MTGKSVVAMGVLLAACGGGGTTGMDPQMVDPIVAAKATASGDGQSAPFGGVLPNPLRVLVSQNGAPVAGRLVTWSVSPASGLANPVSVGTGADGIAASTITLPPVGMTVVVTASVTGATGSPVTFTAEATGAGTAVNVTVDNNLFSPDIFRVQQGGTVTFTWGLTAIGHTVTPLAPNTIPSSSNPAPPGTHSYPYTFETQFPTAGVFKFYCSVHGAPDSGMHGTITVTP